jgi:hypothetical protein
MPDVMDPPGVFIKKSMGLPGSDNSRYSNFSVISFAVTSFMPPHKKIFLSLRNRFCIIDEQLEESFELQSEVSSSSLSFKWGTRSAKHFTMMTNEVMIVFLKATPQFSQWIQKCA